MKENRNWISKLWDSLHLNNDLLNVRSQCFWIVSVTAFISLKFLLEGNVGAENEIDYLPLAKQYVDRTWIPGDWYLNQPQGYRQLFLAIFGRMIVAWGFLATSLIGRFLCYTLVASGLVFLSRKLGLNLLSLLLAVGWFLYFDKHQGLAARESLVGQLEPKSIPYGLILLAIGLMLTGSYRWMAFLLGLATSFHALVGGWASIAVIVWLVWERPRIFQNIYYLISVILIYLAASSLAILTVLEYLTVLTPKGLIEPSYLFVFIRTPHHLNPLSWSVNWWINPLIYLLIFAIILGRLLTQKGSATPLNSHHIAMGLARFTLLTLIPFIVGLVVAPFDSEGKFLQYYPFRVGDVMLPLNTCLLLVYTLETILSGKVKQVYALICIGFLSLICSFQVVTFEKQVLELRQFPSQEHGIEDAKWKDMCDWVRQYTPKDAVVISPSGEFPNFTWLTERATIANFKLIPPTKTGVMSWYERLSDLSGDVSVFPNSTIKGERITYSKMTKAFRSSYNSLNTDQVKAIAVKYKANYFVTRIKHKLDLPISYKNSHYVLYSPLKHGVNS